LVETTHTFEVRALDAAGNVDISPASFSWTIQTPAEAVEDLLEMIENLDPNDLRNANNQTALKNMVEALHGQVTAADLASLCEAIDKLENSILPLTDGEPIPPDWITDPIEQREIEDLINEILAALREDADALGGCS
jgi:hypothetical protein